MKNLYIIRHAKSSWEDSNITDYDRPLNQRGEKDAYEMANKLHNENITPGLIVTSPAKRALKTADIFAQRLNYPFDKIVTDERIYEAGIKELIAVIEGLDNIFDNVMLFGHNPGLTSLVNFISSKMVHHLTTCTVVGIRLKTDSWKKIEIYTGDLFLHKTPKQH